MIKEIDEKHFKFHRLNNSQVIEVLNEFVNLRKADEEKTNRNEEISDETISVQVGLKTINSQDNNDYFFLVLLSDFESIAIGTDKEDNLKDEDIAFDLFIKRRKWKNRKEFFNYCVYPFMISNILPKNQIAENDIIITYVNPLKEFLKKPSSLSKLNPAGYALMSIITYISEGNLRTIKEISKAWSKSLNRKSIETCIFEYVFPNGLVKPSPVEVIKLQSYLLENGLSVQRQAIQQICDKMHIKRLGGKGGRPPKKKEQ